MAKLFNLKIISPDKIIYEGRASSLIAPAVFGYLGVLANHAPLVANLVSGKITLKEDPGKTVVFDLRGKGFLEVLKNKVTILLNS